MEHLENDITMEVMNNIVQTIEQIKMLQEKLNGLKWNFRIPGLEQGKIDVSAYFNHSVHNWDYEKRTIQVDKHFITLPITFRGGSLQAIISLVSEKSNEFKEKLISLSDCKYGYEIYPEGFEFDNNKLPVIIVHGKQYDVI